MAQIDSVDIGITAVDHIGLGILHPALAIPFVVDTH